MERETRDNSLYKQTSSRLWGVNVKILRAHLIRRSGSSSDLISVVVTGPGAWWEVVEVTTVTEQLISTSAVPSILSSDWTSSPASTLLVWPGDWQAETGLTLCPCEADNIWCRSGRQESSYKTAAALLSDNTLSTTTHYSTYYPLLTPSTHMALGWRVNSVIGVPLDDFLSIESQLNTTCLQYIKL